MCMPPRASCVQCNPSVTSWPLWGADSAFLAALPEAFAPWDLCELSAPSSYGACPAPGSPRDATPVLTPERFGRCYRAARVHIPGAACPPADSSGDSGALTKMPFVVPNPFSRGQNLLTSVAGSMCIEPMHSSKPAWQHTNHASILDLWRPFWRLRAEFSPCLVSLEELEKSPHAPSLRNNLAGRAP